MMSLSENLKLLSLSENLKLLGIIAVFLIVLMIVTVTFESWMSYDYQKLDCKKLDGYDYKVRLTGGFWDYKCQVKTTRGVWIDAQDFNIASVEEFVRR